MALFEYQLDKNGKKLKVPRSEYTECKVTRIYEEDEEEMAEIRYWDDITNPPMYLKSFKTIELCRITIPLKVHVPSV